MTIGQNFHTLQKVLIDFVQQSSLATPLIHHIDKLVTSYWFMGNLAQQMIGGSATIKLVMQFIEQIMVKIDSQCCLERELKLKREPIKWFTR